MVLRQYNFILDIVRVTTIPVMEFVQNDTKANVLNIQLTNNNVPINLTGYELTITFKRVNGASIPGRMPTVVNAAEGRITYQLGIDEVALSGKVRGTVEIYGSDVERLTTPVFEYTVRAELAGDIEENEDYPAFTQEMAKIVKMRNDFQDHIDGDAYLHPLQDTTYDGPIPGATNGKQAVDNAYNRVDALITTPIEGAAAAQEVVDARNSAVKSTNYPTVDARLEAIETDVENTKKPSYSTSTTRTAPFSLDSSAQEAGFGQMEVRGLSLRQELLYNRETWAEWSFASATSDATGVSLNCVPAGVAPYARLNTNVKVATKYGILLNIPSNAMTGTTFYIQLADVTISTAIGASEIGNKKYVVTTGATITNNRITIGANNANGNGAVKIKDIRVFELPAGSQIESDFNTKTADEFAIKYPYVPGDRVYHALEDGARVVSTNANLLKELYHASYVSKETVDGRDCYKIIHNVSALTRPVNFLPNTRYTLSFDYKYQSSGSTGVTFIRIRYTDGTYTEYGLSSTTWAHITLTSSAGKTVESIRQNYNNVGVSYIDENTLMLNEGATALPYIPYDGSEVYIPPSENGLGSIGASQDEIDLVTGRKTQWNDKYLLQGSDITYQYLTFTNVDIWGTSNAFGLFDATRILTCVVTHPTLGSFRYQAADTDDVSSINTFRLQGTSGIVFRVTKNAYANTAAAQAGFANTSLRYQLATPIYHDNACSGKLISHANGMVYIDYGCNIYEGTSLGGVMYLPDGYPAFNYVESVKEINLETGIRTPVPFTQPTAGAREFVAGEDGKYYVVIYQGATYSTVPDVIESHAVNRAAQDDQQSKDIERLNEQMAQVESLTRKTAAEILEKRDSTWRWLTAAWGSLPTDADGIPEVVIEGSTDNQIAENGDFENGTTGWTATNATLSAANDIGTMLASAQNAVAVPKSMKRIVDHKYYIFASFKSTSNQVCLHSNGSAISSTTHSGNNAFERRSTILTSGSSTDVWNVGIIDRRTSGYDNIEIDYIGVIDLTSRFGAGNEPSLSDCDERFPSYFEGLQSSSDIRLTATGRNLAGWENKILGANYNVGTYFASRITAFSYDAITGVVTFTDSNGWTGIGYKFKCKPNQAYYGSMIPVSFTNKRNSINWFDLQGNYISSAPKTDDNFVTGISPANADYGVLTFVSSVAGTYSYKNVMLSEGTTATSYTPYHSTSAILPGTFRSLPNGVRDRIRYEPEKGWVKEQKVEEFVSQASDITLDTTSFVNIDVVKFTLPGDYIGGAPGVTGNYYVSGYPEVTNVSPDSASNIGKSYNGNGSSDRDIRLIVAKGTYANVTAARTALAGTKILYQLAASITIPLQGIPALALEPGGTLTVETGVVEFRDRPTTGVLAIPDVTKPIVSVESVHKLVVVDGILQEVPVTPVSNTATTVTVPVSDEVHVVVYRTNPTPLPTIRYRYGINLAAKAAATEGLAVQTSKELSDFERYTIAQMIDMRDRLIVLEGA